MKKERPIMFAGPMALAVHEGRKNKTRRAIKPQPFRRKNLWYWVTKKNAVSWKQGHEALFLTEHCPHGQPGDQLWVKEPLYRGAYGSREGDAVFYEADNSPAWDVRGPCYWPWKRNKLPSMFCPRGLSRRTLDIATINVERLQDITEEDAVAEGIHRWTKDGNLWKYSAATRHVSGELDPIEPWSEMQPTARGAFFQLWDKLNGKKGGFSVADNPFVWVIGW